MIHNRAEHLTGVSAAPSPASGTAGWGSPSADTAHSQSHLAHSSYGSANNPAKDTHLHSPGNSVRLGTATAREKEEAGRTGGEGKDRSTERVVVPFFRLRCALAASLLAVSSR